MTMSNTIGMRFEWLEKQSEAARAGDQEGAKRFEELVLEEDRKDVRTSMAMCEASVRKSIRMGGKNITGAYPSLVDVCKSLMSCSSHAWSKELAEEVVGHGLKLNNFVKGRLTSDWWMGWELWPCQTLPQTMPLIAQTYWGEDGAVGLGLERVASFVEASVGTDGLNNWLLADSKPKNQTHRSDHRHYTVWWLSGVGDKKDRNDDNFEVERVRWGLSSTQHLISKELDGSIGRALSVLMTHRHPKQELIRMLSKEIREKIDRGEATLFPFLNEHQSVEIWKQTLEELKAPGEVLKAELNGLIQTMSQGVVLADLDEKWGLVLDQNGVASALNEMPSRMEGIAKFMDKNGMGKVWTGIKNKMDQKSLMERSTSGPVENKARKAL
jgi:hypothetical protein